MSFDLFLRRPDNSLPSPSELKDYFSRSGHPEIAKSDDGDQFFYSNEATGVYCSFEYDESHETEGGRTSVIAFNLNFMRPSFFAYECMPLVEQVGTHFNLIVEDPQEETV